MNKIATIATVLVSSATLLAAPPVVGPDIVEPPDEDAGSFPDTARDTDGLGSLNSISGNLQGFAGAGASAGFTDFQDAWVICIDDPENWSATLVIGDGGFAVGFDPRLFLFRLDDLGLLGNDDTQTGPGAGAGSGSVPESTLTNMSTDGTMVEIEAGGLYVIIVTSSDFSPQSGGGDIFVFDDPTEISGPDGNNDGIDDWPEPPGACCILDEKYGTFCLDLTPTECHESEGYFAGADIICEQFSCPDIGACCLPDDSCIVTTSGDCEALGGSYIDNEPCFSCSEDAGPLPPDNTRGNMTGDRPDLESGPVNGDYRIIFTGTCFASDVPTGACCLPGGVCLELTELVCLDAGADYQGEGSECAGVVCPGGAGMAACCFDYGACAVLPPIVCVAMDGLPQADGTDCDNFECPDNAGACCFDNGQCAVLPRESCIEMGGLPQGIGTNCQALDCRDLTGACCFDDGSCAFLTRDDCLDQGGLPQGAGIMCGPGICPQPDEACCFDDGDCAVLMPGQCFALGGLPQGQGTNCDIIECPAPPPPPPPALECCEDEDDELATITFEYTAQDCSATSHAQDDDDVDCEDFLPLQDEVWIMVAENDDIDDDDTDIWFAGWVDLNNDNTFVADADNADEDDIDDWTTILIFDGPGGNLLQQVEFRTDCEEPLNTGDQFGASRVVDCVPE